MSITNAISISSADEDIFLGVSHNKKSIILETTGGGDTQEIKLKSK